MENSKARLYSDAEAVALLRKANKLDYPLDNKDFFEYITLWQLDEVVTHGRYDC